MATSAGLSACHSSFRRPPDTHEPLLHYNTLPLFLQAWYESLNFSQLENEIREAQAVCALTHSPIIFGHNDLLSGNILILQKPGFDPASPDRDGPLCFIDYEYGGYTHRGFDIGNHFTEYAGFEGDYTR